MVWLFLILDWGMEAIGGMGAIGGFSCGCSSTAGGVSVAGSILRAAQPQRELQSSTDKNKAMIRFIIFTIFLAYHVPFYEK